jgi:zinc D-Ala-D-Ala carboxypeptidase
MSRQGAAPLALALLVVTGAIIATRVDGSVSFSAPSSSQAFQLEDDGRTPRAASSTLPSFGGSIPGRPRRAAGQDDGVLPDGVTAFDERFPGVANLDGDLRQALRDATNDAAHDGVELDINSGWRSVEYQELLLREAIARYGSEEEAARWVAAPNESAHVSGDAVDVGPVAAMAWLSRHGARYGLCQIYRNEPWHYELRVAAVDRGCPAMYSDSAHDPTIER